MKDHDGEESSDSIVPTTRPNQTGRPEAEDVKARLSAKEILRHGPTPDTAPDTVGALWGREERWTDNRATPQIQGGNRMRQHRKYGSVQGAASNRCPYRDGTLGGSAKDGIC